MNSIKYPMQDKVALVTGAAYGIGRATALAFAQSGARVVLVDTSEEGGIETARIIEKVGGKTIFVRADVSSESDVKAMVERTLQAYGRLDFAFNNAGIEGARASTTDCTSENWDRTLNVNLKGVWLCMKYQIPVMLKQGKGSIVNCSSIAGVVGFAGSPAYTASKHGVVGLTKTAALENAQTGIRVNAVCPGVIQTPMIDRVTGKDPNIIKQLVVGDPMGRVGQPDEIASAVLWLSSDSASYVTGQALTVDGGWTTQ
jgi:NAD(P)-dependent dehydrogenase (short-subunit alcohol dehydrogenase family)